MSITIILVVITVGVSVLVPREHPMYHRLLFNAWGIRQKNEWWRFITHAFLHGDIFHLIFNMYVLYVFGSLLEKQFMLRFAEKGPFYFLLLYFGGIIFSTIVSFTRHQHNPGYYSVGASGAVSAVIFSFIVFEPMRGVGLIFIPIYAPAFIFGFVYLLAEYLMDKFGTRSHIAHDAHLLGGLFGIGFTICLDYTLLMEMMQKIQEGRQG